MKKGNWMFIVYDSDGSIDHTYSLPFLYKNPKETKNGKWRDEEVIAEQDGKLIRDINNRNHPFAKRLHR